MNKEVIRYALSFLFFILLQVMVLNNVSILGYFTPFLYIYFILKLPTSMPANGVITLGFLMGLCIDICSNTPGLNALATVVPAAFRAPLLNVVSHRDEMAGTIPSIYSLGLGAFLRYALFIVLVQNVLIYVIEAFTFFYFLSLLFKIIGSTLLTLILIFGIESFKIKQR